MRKMLTSVLVVLLAVPCLFAAYPDEYPIYLQYLRFTKDEIRGLKDGGMVTHTIRDRLPGEYGSVAAFVSNVPVYYFRDYYEHIESFKTLFQFQQVGIFKQQPDFQDVKALQLDDQELQDFLSCTEHHCGMKLSAAEIASIPKDAVLSSDRAREDVADAYRRILLERLLAYQKEGLSAMQPYVDGETEVNPGDVLRDHLLKFQQVDAYFPRVEKYILEYPQFRNKSIREFFYWAKEYWGNKPVISLRHVFSLKIGEDYVIANKLVYSDHYVVSSLAMIHLVNYADKGVPRTLVVFQQRSLTDLEGSLVDALGRNILRSNLEKRVADGFKGVGKTMEERYLQSAYYSFPYALLPRDQR